MQISEARFIKEELNNSIIQPFILYTTLKLENSMWALIPPVLYALSRRGKYVEAYRDLMKTTERLTGEKPLGLKDALNKLKSYVKKVGVPVEYRERVLENLREIKKSVEETSKFAVESVKVIEDKLMALLTLTLYSEVEMALPSALGYSESNAESFLRRYYQNIKNSIDELERMLRNDCNRYPAVFNFDRVLRNIKHNEILAKIISGSLLSENTSRKY